MPPVLAIQGTRNSRSRWTDLTGQGQDIAWLVNKTHVQCLDVSQLTSITKEALKPLSHLKQIIMGPRTGLALDDVFGLNLPASIKVVV